MKETQMLVSFTSNMADIQRNLQKNKNNLNNELVKKNVTVHT